MRRMMAVETGRRKLTSAPRLVGRRDQVPSAAKTSLKLQASLHTLHHSFHHLRARPHGDSSSRLCFPPNLLLRSPFLVVPLTLLLLTPWGRITASVETSLSGKALNFGRVWSGRGRHIFGIANNRTLSWGSRVLFLFLRGCTRAMKAMYDFYTIC